MTRRMKIAGLSAVAIVAVAATVPALAGRHHGDRHALGRDEHRHASGRDERGDDDRHDRPVAEMRIVDGQVRRLLVNPVGAVDGLLLASGAVVQLPAHMSDALIAAVRPGDRVTVQGMMTPARQDIRARSLRTARGTMLTVARAPFLAMPRFLRSSPQTPVSAMGTIIHVVAGKRGEARALVFGDGTTARLDKHVARTSPNLQPGMSVALTGHGTSNRYGRGIAVETIARR